MNYTAEDIIKLLDLIPHPEGGFYRETYRSDLFIPDGVIKEFKGGRNCTTSIYYMLTSDSFSSFHRIRQDEIWHYYLGDAIRIHMLSDSGETQSVLLGTDFKRGQLPQHVVPANTWFAAESEAKLGFSLVGCNVSPGFDFQDFELGCRENLVGKYPDHVGLIERLTRN